MRSTLRKLMLLSMIGLFCLNAGQVSAADPYAGSDPYWVLLHEPAVVEELNLSFEQQRSYQQTLDGLDARFFPLRNQSREVSQARSAEIIRTAHQAMESLLKPAQQTRLNELLMRTLGNNALLREEIVQRLGYTDEQKQRIKEINDETNITLKALQKEATKKKSESVDKKFNELQTGQQKKLIAVLKPAQRAALVKIFGADFDLSKLGQPRYKAPEIVNTGQWLNTRVPLSLSNLRGKVVVLHFYAFSCSNCKNNYAWYRQWNKIFPQEQVVILGIHTPETATERNTINVRQNAAENGFRFPILIDGKSQNWNAWGNSMWPTVYLIDKQGYFRDLWQGELNWQGNNGEQYMRNKIQQLRDEKEAKKS